MTRLDGTAAGSATPRWPGYLRDALLLFSGLSILAFLYFDILKGGNDFKQGDWLISNSFQTVRRGLFGSALLRVSDLTQVSPLIVLGLVQAALVIALYVMLRQLLVRIPRHHALLMVLCPAFFVVFWPANDQGSLRKELIGFVAIALAIVALRGNRNTGLVAAAVLLVIGMLANELNSLFVPAFLVLVYFNGTPDLLSALRRLPRLPLATHAICLSTILFAVAAVWYAFSHWEADPGLVCKPLLERSLRPEICDGAIRWLGPGYDARANEFFVVYLKPGYLIGHAALFVLSLLPLFYLVAKARIPASLALLCAISVAPVLALYPLVTDWGRLMDIQAFLIAGILLSGTLGGEFWKDEKVDGLLLGIYGLSIFVWTPAHTNGLVEGGLGAGINSLLGFL